MAFERFDMKNESYGERFGTRDESYGVFLNSKAPPVVSERMRDESYGVFLNSKAGGAVSERPTKIVDCHGLQFLCSTPIYLYATKDEYHGNSSPKTTSTSRAPLPHPPRGYYPQAVGMGNQVPNLTKTFEVPLVTARKQPITIDEAAKLFEGILITEYRAKKQYRA